MKKTLKGYVLGVLTVALLTGGVALAKSSTEYIEVTYDNIKVYKDNVLCELTDGNGGSVEPFIYNGTTYLPVRGTANLAGMTVDWDGNTKSVKLYDEIIPNDTYLMDVCPPYETKYYERFLQLEGKSFKMAGKSYSNGFRLSDNYSYALFNLNSKYSNIEFTVGHIDGTSMSDVPMAFFVDGKLIKEITIGAEDLPKTISIPVSHGLQLKILATEDVSGGPHIGFGNITVH